MFHGHLRARSKHLAILSVPSGHSKILSSKTWSKALVERLASVNNSSSRDCKNGVCNAGVNLLPASAKHICSSSSVFVLDSAQQVLSMGWGPMTWLSPCLGVNPDRACLIIQALLQIFSVLQFSHRDFFETFWSCAWAWMSCPIYISCLPFSLWGIGTIYMPAWSSS